MDYVEGVCSRCSAPVPCSHRRRRVHDRGCGSESRSFLGAEGGWSASYAVILSATFKTFTDLPSAGSILNINSTHTTNATLFWEGVNRFHKYSNHFVDNGLYVYFEIGTTGQSLHIQPFVAINQTTAQLAAILKPLYDDLNAIGLKYEAVTMILSSTSISICSKTSRRVARL